jgi:hypothetical protein
LRAKALPRRRAKPASRTCHIPIRARPLGLAQDCPQDGRRAARAHCPGRADLLCQLSLGSTAGLDPDGLCRPTSRDGPERSEVHQGPSTHGLRRSGDGGGTRRGGGKSSRRKTFLKANASRTTPSGHTILLAVASTWSLTRRKRQSWSFRATLPID